VPNARYRLTHRIGRRSRHAAQRAFAIRANRHAQISSSDTATPTPFALDYAQFDSLSPADKLAMQELAWRQHGPWILRQLGELRAQWILTAGGEVVDSGGTLDTSHPTNAAPHSAPNAAWCRGFSCAPSA
jgi:hypothetical protein